MARKDYKTQINFVAVMLRGVIQLLTDVSVAECPAGGATGAWATVAENSVVDADWRTSLVTVAELTTYTGKWASKKEIPFAASKTNKSALTQHYRSVYASAGCTTDGRP